MNGVAENAIVQKILGETGLAAKAGLVEQRTGGGIFLIDNGLHAMQVHGAEAIAQHRAQGFPHESAAMIGAGEGIAYFIAVVFGLGFLSGVEVAQAAFLLMLPFAVISYSKLRLALAVRRRGIAGPPLVLALARRRLVHQFVAIVAMLAAAALAVALHPERLPPL